jgi:amino acid adenylation domain-containing protein
MELSEIQTIRPVTPLQEVFLPLAETEAGGHQAGLTMIVEFSGPLNHQALESAWQREIDQRQTLRSAVAWKSAERPLQIVLKRQPLSLEMEDWSGFAANEREAFLRERLQSESFHTLNSDSVPWRRPLLVKLGKSRHQLIWSCHPVLLDARSLRVVLRNVCENYQQIVNDDRLPVPRPDLFPDYVARLREREFSNAETYWRQRLAGWLTPTPLLAEVKHDRKSDSPRRLAELQISLPPATMAGLRSWLDEWHVTPNVLLMSVWAALLSRYSGEEEVFFGLRISDPYLSAGSADQVVGPLTGVLPWKSQIRDGVTALEWLKEARKSHEALVDHSYVSNRQIQQWLRLSDEQLQFRSVVNMEGLQPKLSISLPEGLKIENVEIIDSHAAPLTLEWKIESEGAIQITYDPCVYEAGAIQHALDGVKNALVALSVQPDIPLSALPFMDEATTRRVVFDWNETAVELAGELCVHHLFEFQAEMTPDTVAAVFGHQRISYSELNRRANRLANHLWGLGVGPEALVGIFLDRGLETLVAILGVLKAGGAYAPLDINFPLGRINDILEDALPLVILSKTELAEKLPSHWAQVVCLDGDWETIAHRDSHAPASGVRPDNLAYVIYTSGSTGTPKGVMVSHRGVRNLAEAQARTLGVKREHHILQFASVSFDASVFEIVMALAAGATSYLSGSEEMMSGPACIEYLRDQNVNIVTLPPSVLSALPGDESLALETVIAAGEECSAAVRSRWIKGRRFLNAYGPTETTVWATLSVCDEWQEKLDIGRPICNVQVYLFDNRLTPVPVGALGELYIGGVGLARGYLNRASLTAEKFLPHPFAGEPGSRIYKTGDLANYKSDGRLNFAGRLDHQVKLRGLRIETEEIEFFLKLHPGIRDAAVAVRRDQAGEPWLAAYIILGEMRRWVDSAAAGVSGEEDLSFVGVRSYLKPYLPEYMLPQVFIPLETFPLTTSGKVDRKSLPDPDWQRRSPSSNSVPPRTRTEEALMSIWKDILRLDRAGIYDNFFESGGHSLLATQMLARIHDEFEVDLDLRTVFESPSIESLAEILDIMRWSRNGHQVSAARGVEMEEGVL